MLDENFMPPLSIAPRTAGGVYVIDRCADNLLIMLDFMHKTQPKLYDQLQTDLSWLLGHVDRIFTERTDQETRLVLTEKGFDGREAPTVSAGTARVLAMLTAFYALDMRYATLPGLVVIEEPDTALNPGLLRNFVEQLRYYVDGEHPRQVMLTTHNPAFLDYFKPEEVRVVMRNEDGDTTVNQIPEHVRKIWLDEYGLGEVWRTNSFGGLP
ncbi:MAG: AAA family ATPase [Chloroflexi bacterium]|nr:AAA family ATPase [Chloroflexota bacterium]